MSSILEAECQSLDASAASADATFQAINLRNKLHKDLSNLLTHVAWEASQTEGNICPILEIVHEHSAGITNDLESFNFDPIPNQLNWLIGIIKELTSTLQTRGQLHILDIK